MERFRAHGPPYEKPGAPPAYQSLRGAARADIDRSQILTGHIPTSIWDRHIDIDEAVFISILRDPIDRFLSHYRHGIQIDSWRYGTKLSELADSGRLADNLQVRMLAGCSDVRQRCDDDMLDAALQMMQRRCFVVGLTDDFETFLGSLITLCDWPQIIYSKYQVGTMEIPGEDLKHLQVQARELNRLDLELIAEVRRRGPVWINRLDVGHPPAREDDTVLVVSPFVTADDNKLMHFGADDLDNFEAMIRGRGGKLIRKAIEDRPS